VILLGVLIFKKTRFSKMIHRIPLNQLSDYESYDWKIWSRDVFENWWRIRNKTSRSIMDEWRKNLKQSVPITENEVNDINDFFEIMYENTDLQEKQDLKILEKVFNEVCLPKNYKKKWNEMMEEIKKKCYERVEHIKDYIIR
jgi:hypothetical protein